MQKERGMAIMLITHDLGVVAEVCDRVVVMYAGRVAETGSIEDIFERPMHPYTVGLLSSLQTGLRRVRGYQPSMEQCRVRSTFRRDAVFVIGVIGLLRNVLKSPRWSLASMAAIRRGVIILKGESIGGGVAMTEPLLKVRNLKTHFPVMKGIFRRLVGTVKAVDGVSFDLMPGETISLVGESGCGKTTCGRSILRLVEPNSGEVHFRGRIYLNWVKPS